ncbi:MtrB/PioB family decaheme-associated outer membrane protein [Noviherbaspirillum sp. UKPF54]|uniref:MtrB/PioB family decaheme-associated outer membrane protein n=1 Tax=Noviherbaspirillum sp. UKPF54 TaxID=2601898 RepID=UPI00143D1534|nr:MtrB/PioB family decaheme-associated outer membrane protein [Noviherbaspirillum sp. UKPF54]
MKNHRAFPLAAMAAALAAVYGPACAQQDDDLNWLTKPSSSVSVGAGYLNKDAPQFGRYTGVRDAGTYGLLNIDLNKLDESTGTWVRFKGNNLGLENRDMRFTHERQGDWGYYLEYSELPRFEPHTVNTAVRGIGTASLAIPTTRTNGPAEQLKMKREMLGAGFTKQLGDGFDLVVRAKSEDKDGARIFSRGTATNAFEFTPEPVHSTTRQLEAILGYSGKQLQMSAIYYGTAYDNHNTALTLAGGNTTAFSGTNALNPIALPPDSQSHQLALDGGYSFTPTTRGSFKVAYSRATQNDTFISGVPLAAGIAPDGNLGGRVDTTLVQMGVSARPVPKLSLVADLRQENRDDKTPVRTYTVTGVTAASSFNGENQPISIKTTNGKVEATYQLQSSLRMTGGIDYDVKDRNTSAIRSVSFRDRTEETSYRVALKRTMSETVTGSIAYIRSDRNGSDFLNNVLKGGATGSNLIAPLNLADRERDKVRLSLSWTPTNDLSVQFMADQTRDDYSARTANDFGLRDGSSKNYSVDVSYAFANDWQASGWISRNDTLANRATRISASNPWSSKLENNSDSFGLSLRGKPREKWDVGADLSHSEIGDLYRQQAISGAAVTSLPDVYTRLTNLKLFASYALRQNASLRFDYIYDRYSTNDWSWSSWNYSDGTTLTQAPRQYISFFGVTYIYRFQ